MRATMRIIVQKVGRVLNGVLVGLLVACLASIPVLAAYYAHIKVTESMGKSYTALALTKSLDVDYLRENHYITPSGRDTAVTTSSYISLPHMLAEDRLLWVANISPSTTTEFIFWTGQELIDSFPVITGHGGYVTIPDDPVLEPGDIYAFGIVGYVDTSSEARGPIIRKANALSFDVTGVGELTFCVAWGNSLVVSGVPSGFMTIMIYSDGEDMWMTINDIERDRAEASLVPDTDTSWYLFQNDVMPYVSYYGEWVVP